VNICNKEGRRKEEEVTGNCARRSIVICIVHRLLLELSNESVWHVRAYSTNS
jgi:hypothetical protein